MSIDAFTSPMGPSAVLTRLNEIVTALNGVTGAAANVVEVTNALYPSGTECGQASRPTVPSMAYGDGRPVCPTGQHGHERRKRPLW